MVRVQKKILILLQRTVHKMKVRTQAMMQVMIKAMMPAMVPVKIIRVKRIRNEALYEFTE